MTKYLKNLEPFMIGSHCVEFKKPPLYLPDIGTFFNQDIDIAIRMIDELKESKIKIIKGEILHSPDVCLPGESFESYLASDGVTTIQENYRELIERKVVSLSDYDKIFEHCRQQKIEFVVSVYDDEGVAFAIEQKAVALKASSSNITHFPLLATMAKAQLPIIIDTGHSTIDEALRAVKWVRETGENRIIVQHSPPAPPRSVGEHNLNMMLNLGAACESFFGLSDHHDGTEMLMAATSMGAQIIEKGVYPIGLENEQDLMHAMSLSQVKSVNNAIQNVFKAMGNGEDRDLSNKPAYKSRMCLVAKMDLPLGEKLSRENVTFAFPPLGIGCEYWPTIEGKALVKALKKGDLISWDNIGSDNA